MGRRMTNWVNSDPWGYRGLGTHSPAPVDCSDAFSDANLNERLAWVTTREHRPKCPL
jgi:hypothetical protein